MREILQVILYFWLVINSISHQLLPDVTFYTTCEPGTHVLVHLFFVIGYKTHFRFLIKKKKEKTHILCWM
jgi:phosphotransferase system  glucose/maltose/N-acetylglucosamine-specific IIC component